MRQNIIRKPLQQVSILKWFSIMIAFFFLTLFLSPSYARPNPIIQPISNQIQLACNATRHPQYCTTSLTQQSNLVLSSNDPTPVQIIQSAISVSTATLTVTQSKLQTLLTVANTQGNHNITNVVSICLEVLGYSNRRMSSSNDSISSPQSGRIKDVRAWMSAALSYQYDCYGGLTYYASNYAHLTSEPISSLTNLINETSNALGMVVSYDRFGNDMSLWRRVETERDGFWEESNHEAEFNSEFPSEYLQVDVIVCKESGYCGYKKIQEAVDAAPSNLVDSKRFVIHIREGVYEEIVRIPFEKKNVVFLGAGMGKTIITGDLAVNHQPGVTTYDSATVGVLGDGFMATNLTIQNTAGAPEHQAVAFRSDSDLSMLVNCEFLGNQDTLYAHSLRQYYKSCRITGNVDFIFGNAAAVFQNCLIQLVPRLDNPESGGLNAITAQGRTDPVQSTGFVFVNCTINGTPEYMALFDKNPSVHKNYLGRPWKEYSRAVFIHCELGSVVASEGWMPWDGEYGLNTLYYGEFGNRGDGFDRGKRVKWSSQVPEEHVDSYSLQSFIQGDWWIPKTHS